MKVQPGDMLELLTYWKLDAFTLRLILRVGGRNCARVLG